MTNDPYKIAFIERLEFVKSEGTRLRPTGSQINDVEYRIGYFIVARNGKWWFGQFAPFIPADDFQPLLQLARDEGTLLDDLDIRRR